MTRERLPNRRIALGFDVPHPTPGSTVSYKVNVGRDSLGAVREVFIGCNKLTTGNHIAGLELATLISIALQHGAGLAELAGAMPRESTGSPQGVAGAVLDAVLAETEHTS